MASRKGTTRDGNASLMSGRRASMSDAPDRYDPVGDAADLHVKLHALEAVRAKEMRAHGELTRQLQTQLEVARNSEKELQLAVAKLRADNCRLEADSGSGATKLRASEDEGVATRRQHERVADDFRQRLLTKEEEVARLHAVIDSLKSDRAQAAVVDAERTTQMTAMAREIDRLTHERNDARLAQSADTQEITQLATRLAVKQAELEVEKAKTEQMREELNTREQRLVDQSNQMYALTRACERLEITRLRLAAWGRVRVANMERDVRFRDVFLEWKAQMLAAKATQTRGHQERVKQRLKHLVCLETELESKLKTTRAALTATKLWFCAQQQNFQAWEEVTKAQFSTLILTRLQHERAEAIRICDERVATLSNQLQTERDQLNAQLTTAQQHAAQLKITSKRRVDALVTRILQLHSHVLRSQAFQGWKDVYLRNVVAETTHAVMVARTARSLAVATTHSDRLRDDNDQVQPTHKTASSPTTYRVAVKTQAATRHPELTAEPFARDAEEEQWKRWRRVAPANAKALPPPQSASSRRSSVTSCASTMSSSPRASTSSHRTVPASAADHGGLGKSTSRRRASMV